MLLVQHVQNKAEISMAEGLIKVIAAMTRERYLNAVSGQDEGEDLCILAEREDIEQREALL